MTSVCVCVCPSSQPTTVQLKTWNILIRSEKVTANTSEAFYKLQVQTISSYTCSTSSMAAHACIQTQYTHHRAHKSISKPHPQAFASNNTAVMRMDTDCLCRLRHFSSFSSPHYQGKTRLYSLTKPQIFTKVCRTRR